MKNNGFTWRKRLYSFVYAFRGIRLLISSEANAWIHCFAAVCVISAGLFFTLAPWEWVAVIMAIGLVFSAEAFNSAVETLADRITGEYDEAIRRTKDLASGAVLIQAMAAAVIGCIIFIPKIISLWQS